MFRTFGPVVAAVLQGTTIDEWHGRSTAGPSAAIDLGGRSVELRATGKAHTLGDQTVHVPDCGVVFMGDLWEERMFPTPPNGSRRTKSATSTRRIGRACSQSARRGSAAHRGIPGHGAQGGEETARTVRDYTILILVDG